MEKPTPPCFEDFGLTEEKYLAVKNDMLSSWSTSTDCLTCRKVRRGVEYVIRSLTDGDCRARRRYDEALRQHQIKLNAFRQYISKSLRK